MKAVWTIIGAVMAAGILGAPADAQIVVQPYSPDDDTPVLRSPPPPPVVPPQAGSTPQPPRLTSAERIRFGLEDNTPYVDLFLDQTGGARVTVTVGTDGRARDCTVVSSSGYVGLDRVACDVMLRYGRFDPARDGAGAPVEGKYTQPLRWGEVEDISFYREDIGFVYPPEALAAGVEGTTRITFKVGPDGRASGCTVTETSGSDVLDAATCAHVAKLRGSPRGPEVATDVTLIPVERAVVWSLSEAEDAAEPQD